MKGQQKEPTKEDSRGLELKHKKEIERRKEKRES